MVERKNTGLAVSDAKRLNDCYHELSEAIAARPEMPGDRKRWHYNYAALEGGPAGAEREAWNHKCGSNNIAEDALRGAITSGNLKLWTNGPHGEATVDRHELKELTFRTFASGTYQPNNRSLDNAGLAESPLWVKEVDWQQYLADVWTVRYGIDWANPAPPTDKSLLPPEGQFVTLSHALTWIAFGVSIDRDQLFEVLKLDHYGNCNPQEAIKAAVAELTDKGSGGKVALRGKFRESHRTERRGLLVSPIEPAHFMNFAMFNELHDALEHGEGMFHWRVGKVVTSGDGHGGNSASYFDVSVNRADLLREFRPQNDLVKEDNAKRAPAVKQGRPPKDDAILAKADEMKARGMDGRTLAKRMRFEPGFENVATTDVRELIKGRWRPGRPATKSA